MDDFLCALAEKRACQVSLGGGKRAAAACFLSLCRNCTDLLLCQDAHLMCAEPQKCTEALEECQLAPGAYDMDAGVGVGCARGGLGRGSEVCSGRH